MVFVCLLTFATGVAWSSWHPEFRIQQPPSIRVNEMSLNSRSVCLEEAAYIGRVDPALLQAIVTVESGEHPYAFGWFDKTGVRRFY
ncbi:MAG: hypothetical protein ACREJU_16000, partial [Nitrospiraceae bacterium]